MKNRTKIYSCKNYDIYRDTTDGAIFAYDKEGIFITCVNAFLHLKHFKMIVEDILENGYPKGEN